MSKHPATETSSGKQLVVDPSFSCACQLPINVFTPQGFVFLDIYDIGEYNPFLLEVKQPPDPKVVLLLTHFMSS